MKSMKIALCLILPLVSLLCSCAPGIQPLLDDYNSMFDMTTSSYFFENGVFKLKHKYSAANNTTFSVSAPAGGSSYKWELKSAQADSTLPKGFDINKYGGNTRHLVINLLAAGFPEQAPVGTYRLTLTFTYGGTVYTDTTELVIHQPASTT